VTSRGYNLGIDIVVFEDNELNKGHFQQHSKTFSRSIWSYLKVYLLCVSFSNANKKLSYRRETAHQLPTWRG